MITVVVRNNLHQHPGYFCYQPKYETYHGELIPNPSWVANDSICISGNDFLPMRVIKRASIVSMNGETVAAKPQPVEIKTYPVVGSKGDRYVVTNDRSLWSCTCTGFTFHKDCRHIRSVKNSLTAS